MDFEVGRGGGASNQPPVRVGALFFLLAICGLALVLVWPRMQYRRTEFRTCFQNAGGLRPGTGVRVGGVAMGVVRTVSGGDSQCPVEVAMTVRTRFGQEVPADAVAALAVDEKNGAGVVDIDIRSTSAGPVRENGFLKSRETAVGAAAATSASKETSKNPTK